MSIGRLFERLTNFIRIPPRGSGLRSHSCYCLSLLKSFAVSFNPLRANAGSGPTGQGSWSLSYFNFVVHKESVQRQLNSARRKSFLSVHLNITLQNGTSSRGLLAKILPFYALFIPSDSHSNLSLTSPNEMYKPCAFRASSTSYLLVVCLPYVQMLFLLLRFWRVVGYVFPSHHKQATAGRLEFSPKRGKHVYLCHHVHTSWG